MQMNIVKNSIDGDELSTRILRIHVRVKAIIEALIGNTTAAQGKGPIFKFLRRLTMPGKFIPDDYFSAREKSMLTLDLHGRIM